VAGSINQRGRVMYSKIFSFNRLTKSPKIIEDKINGFFAEGHLFLTANVIGSSKLIFSLICSPCQDVSKLVKCKVFRTNDPKDLEGRINKFIVGVSLKNIYSVLSGTSTTYTILFYHEPEFMKEEDGSNEAKGAGSGQTGTTGSS